MNDLLRAASEKLKNYSGKKVRIMEVCGTHTHEIMRLGIRKILSEDIQLISGPGCPVCVTEEAFIEKAVFLAEKKNCTILSFGDLLRVPGIEKSLLLARAEGARIETVYCAMDSVKYALSHPKEDCVFLSIGFETTVPGNLLAVKRASELSLSNFSMLSAMKTMPGAYRLMADSTDAFLYPGHVCAITGTKELEELRDKGISGVVSGFSAEELLSSILYCVDRISKGNVFFKNLYPRVVTQEGSSEAKRLISEMTVPVDSNWRGIGVIKGSGLALSDEYSDFDAEKKYDLPLFEEKRKTACRCGDVLTGRITPNECPLFGKACTPEKPVGACMVSSEGACSAYYDYGGKR